MDLPELEQTLADHEDMEFPEFPDDPDFADWVDELFEIDDYYFGLLHSQLEEGDVDPVDKTLFETLKARFAAFDGHPEQDVYQSCMAYLDSLEKLLEAT